MSDTHTTHQPPLEKHSLHAYVIGFVLSDILTFAAYLVVTQSLVSKTFVVPAIILLAIAQLFVQLFFFLHLGREERPRWNLVVLLSAATVVVIIVIGSLWIMKNLDYHEMTPQEIKTYLKNNEGL